MSTSPSGNSGKRSRVCAMTPKATGAPDRRRLGTRRGMGRISRRELIVSGALAAGALAGSPRLLREALAAPARAGAGPYGPLGPPDANGLMLPPGFSSREIARGLSHVAGYAWPSFPDGQATFATRDGGWVLVTNSESLAVTGAGAARARRVKPGGARGGAGGPPAVPDRGRGRRRLLPLHADRLPESARGAARGGRGGGGRERRLARGAGPDANPSRAPNPAAGARDDPLQRRRGHLARRRRPLLHDEGRQAPVGLRHAHRDARGRVRPRHGARLLARRRGQRDGVRGGRDLRVRGRREHGDRADHA